MTVRIEIIEETAELAHHQLTKLLNMSRLTTPVQAISGAVGARTPSEVLPESDTENAQSATTEEAANAASDKPKRTRRTKAEIQAEKAQEAGEVDPPEVAAQDVEDEAAERRSPTTLTHDDARAVMQKYIDAFGIDAASEDGPGIVGMFVLGGRKIVDLPDDQPTLIGFISAVEDAAGAGTRIRNPVQKTPSDAAEENVACAYTRDDLIAALKEYGKVFGIDEVQKDGPRFLRLEVPGAQKVSDVPDDPGVIGALVSTINAALASGKRPAFKE